MTPLKNQMKYKTVRDGQWIVVPIVVMGLGVMAIAVAVLLRSIHG